MSELIDLMNFCNFFCNDYEDESSIYVSWELMWKA